MASPTLTREEWRRMLPLLNDLEEHYLTTLKPAKQKSHRHALLEVRSKLMSLLLNTMEREDPPSKKRKQPAESKPKPKSKSKPKPQRPGKPPSGKSPVVSR